MLGIVAVGVVRESRKFSGHMYRVHFAVIFAIAQLSCSNNRVRNYDLITTKSMTVTCLCKINNNNDWCRSKTLTTTTTANDDGSGVYLTVVKINRPADFSTRILALNTTFDKIQHKHTITNLPCSVTVFYRHIFF